MADINTHDIKQYMHRVRTAATTTVITTSDNQQTRRSEDRAATPRQVDAAGTGGVIT